MIKRLKPKSQFAQHVLTLMTGTTIAQAIPIAVSPILTRIYTPEDFGVLALFTAITAVLGILVTGRYEVAVILPKKDKDAANILVLAALIALFMSLIIGVGIYFIEDLIIESFGNEGLRGWLYFIPASIFLSGMYQSLTFWNNRFKKFGVVATSQVGQGGGTAGTQLGFGLWSNLAGGGLILGNLVGQLTGTLVLAIRSWKELKIKIPDVSRERITENAREYKNFPLFSTWGALFNTAGTQMPVVIISRFYGLTTGGLFSLTFRVLSMPISLISGAFYNVLLQRVTQIHNEEPEKLVGFILRAGLFLAVLSLPIIIVMVLWGEPLFVFVFGENWAEAGQMAAILSVAVAMRFTVSPLSSVLALNHNVKTGVFWQTLYFFTLATTLLLASKYDMETFLRIFVVHEIVLYGLFFGLIMSGARWKPEAIEGSAK
jgi:O-antigen/teichoic acid export membrane protein